MYQILSDEGFADILIAKLVGSDFGQKIAAACEMEQQLLEKMNLLADNVQKVQLQPANESGSSKVAAQDSKNKSDNNQNEFDKLVQASLDRLKNYAQEQLKRVIAHKESLAEGLKNIFKNISTEIPGLLTALLGKKMLDLFNGWWPKTSKAIEGKLAKIFKIDKNKDNSPSPSADNKQPINANVQQPKKQEVNEKTSNTQENPDSYKTSTAVKVFKENMDEKKTNYTQIMMESFNRINSSAEQHFNKMLTGAESFSQGFKSIFKDMTTEISKMLLEIVYKKAIEKPLGKWFGNFLDTIFKADGGPVSSQTSYIVGERGPELFVPDQAGTIVPNHRLGETLAIARQQVTSGANYASSVTGIQTPPVIVNVVNKSGVQANTKQETSWDGQQYVINVVMDAYARNVNGMRDVLGVRR
jgi:hypothetical protein